MGDSLAAGVGDPSPGYAPQGWTDRLADVLRRVHPGLAYLNAARTGATVEDTLAGQLDRVRAFGPDLLHVSCGAIVADMWDHPVNSRADLLSADGVHFSCAGQAVLAAELVKALAQVPA